MPPCRLLTRSTLRFPTLFARSAKRVGKVNFLKAISLAKGGYIVNNEFGVMVFECLQRWFAYRGTSGTILNPKGSNVYSAKST